MPIVLKRKALTLVECLLAISILSGTILAVSYTVVAGNQHALYADRASTAGRIASDFLEEISSKAFVDPGENPVFGKETGETTRAQFDDVDDYHGYAASAGELANSQGTLYDADDQVFSIAITVESAAQPFLGLTLDGNLVTLTLTHNNGEKWIFTRFIPEP